MLLVAGSCGTGGVGDAVAPPPPVTATPSTLTQDPSPVELPRTTGERAPPPPSTDAAPPPAGSSDTTPPGGGGPATDALGDALATLSTMAESAAPLPLPEPPGSDLEGVEGVVAVPVASADHVRYDVEYPTAPPAGGPHLGVWLNCGFYTVPVLDELAVHSLEHGAVWVTYRSDTDSATLAALQARAAQSSHLLVSPYEAQAAPLVLSAWARQLSLESPEDARFDQFLDVYLFDGPTAPEPGAACSGAVGVPPEHPEAIPQQG